MRQFKSVQKFCWVLGIVAAAVIVVPSAGLKLPLLGERNAVDEEALMDPAEIIQKHNYTLEVHKIRTKDDYILTAFRIPDGKVSEGQRKIPREPVLITHGFINSASDWLVVSADRALPFLLADAGYDVWLGNFRGSDYALEHAQGLTPSDFQFWNFSMNEMGDFDVPAQIDYILERSTFTRVNYVGFSMGAAILWMTLSTYPEYNLKVHKMAALAPAAYKYMATSALYPAPFSPDGPVLTHYDTFHNGEFLPQPRRPPKESTQMCADSPDTCSNYMASIGGYNPKHTNKTTTVRVSGHSPARASVRTYVHYRQYVRKRSFARYDYGFFGNLAAYGSTSAPLYDFKKVTVPVYGMYGMNDLLVTPDSAKRQLEQLPNWTNRGSGVVDDPQWSHLDFCYADAVKPMVYDHVLEFFKQS